MRNHYLLAIGLIIIGGIFGNILRFTGHLPDKGPDFSLIPGQLEQYVGKEIVLDESTYEVLKADTSIFRDYLGSDQSRDNLFVAYFKSQKYGSQIHSPKHCLPGGGWRIETIRPYRLKLPDGTAKEVNLLTITNGEYKSVMFYWYQTRSGSIRSEYGLKLDLVKNSLLFRPTDAAIIRLTVDAPEGDIKQAVAQGVRFLDTFYPYIARSLPF